MEIKSFAKGGSMLLGVVGNPLAHSISPQLHNTLSDILGKDCVYVPLRMDEDDFDDGIRGIKALGFKGFNVTIPYKNKILKHMDVISQEASLIGAVNTVKIKDGLLYGHNTDVRGFYDSFTRETGVDFNKKQVVILGGGGAARAVALAVVRGGPSRMYLVNRTIKKAEAIGDIIKKYSPHTEITCHGAIDFNFGRADILINTTSVGMYPDTGAIPFGQEMEFSPSMVVYDLIYNPPETGLLKKASHWGAKTVNGLGMLIYQGIRAYEIWMDMKVEDDVSKAVLDGFRKYL